MEEVSTLEKIRAIRDEHSTFAGRNRFRAMEAEHPDVSKASSLLAMKLRAKCFRGVLDQGNPVWLKQRTQCDQIRHVSIKVHGDHRFRACSNRALDRVQ